MLLLSIAPAVGHAESFDCQGDIPAKEAAGLLGRVESRYDTLRGFQAEFLQQSVFVGLEQHETSKGQLFFEKPGKMNWLYSEPEEQRFIADGKTVWFYQPALNQVTVDAFRESFTTDLPVTFLLGLGKLGDAFTLKSSCKTEEGFALDLEPKSPDSNLQKFVLLVHREDAMPYGAKVLDLGGNETTIVLYKQELNPTIAPQQFTFSIPRGVDVIDNRGANQSAPRAGIIEDNLSDGGEAR